MAHRLNRGPRTTTIVRSALSDLKAGMAKWRVWVALASEDIGDQHRRTTLGPLWLLLNYLAFAGTFIFVFHSGSTAVEYRSYVATGLVVWFFIMEIITTSVTLFVREESFIRGTTLPLSVHVMRAVLQSVIRAGYAVIGCFAILVFSGVTLASTWAWSLLGIAIILAIAPAVVTCFAFLGVLFPDSQFIVSNFMRIAMFLTPVFWSDPGGGGIRSSFYHYNPFTWLLEIVRTPILTGEPALRSLVLSVGIGIALWALAIVLLGSFRRQVALLI